MRGLSLLLGACGMVAALLLWRVLTHLIPPDPAAATMAVRLGRAAAMLLPSALVLAAMILAQMVGRLAAGAIDPLAGGDTHFLRVNQRVITNTVEQLAVFAPGLLALAAAVPGQALSPVLALGVVFALARLVFWAGYLIHPVARAPGMAANASVNVATLLAAAWFWFR